jgi:hypothetical protein
MKSNLTNLFGVLCSLLLTQATQAAVFEYRAALSGANEPPTPTPSPGTGLADVFFNDAAMTLEVKVVFSGLLGTTMASHIHAPTPAPASGSAGVATTTPTFANFPLGVTSGTYDQTLDLLALTSYNPAFVTANGGTAAGAEAALVSALNAGRSYLNIHTTSFPGGEISGYLTRVPDTSPTALLLGAASVVMLCFTWRREPRLALNPLERKP